jgi:very-short-patch-repair endonuclease
MKLSKITNPVVRAAAKKAKGKSPAKKSNRSESPLERKFMALWRELNGPPLEREYKFCDTRCWRADFAYLPGKLLIEIEGGTWGGGRHTRGKGYQADCEKYNHATLAGWRVIRFTGSMLTVQHVGPLLSLIASLSCCHT